ncbi:MAG: DUF4350 domain-containing protein [Sinobacteraceae bacterium]|nr:DUF4350 domain-containing protein [Nevskiaceae bacterium]
MSSERGTTAILALGALLLFFVLMFGGRGSGMAGAPPRPTSAESSGNGYSIMRRWLESEGIAVGSLRESFDALARLAPSGAGRESLLVLTLPGAGPIQTGELQPLDRWLREGNTLLVIAALSDAPDWARGPIGADAFDLKAVTGLDFEAVPQRERRLALERRTTSGTAADTAAEAGDASPAAAEAADESLAQEVGRPTAAGPAVLLAAPRRETAEVVPGVPWLEGVSELAAESDYRRTSGSVRLPYGGIVFELARDQESGEGVLWSRPFGRGRIVVSAYGTLLSNRAIGLADNSRLLASLVAQSVGPDGMVLFDDGHQGLSVGYDPQQLFGDRRLYLTCGMLVALWLLWVLGATRLRTPRLAESAPRPGELLQAAGGFFARVLPSHVAAQRLLGHFFARLPVVRRQQADDSLAQAPPWDWLQRQPGIDSMDVQQLRDWYAAARNGRPVPLEKLHNLLCGMEKRLA